MADVESCLEEVGSRYRNRKRPKLPAVECIWVQKPSIRATVASRQTRPLDNTSILGNRSAGKPWGTWICPVDLCVEYLFCQLFNPSCCPPLLPPPHTYLPLLPPHIHVVARRFSGALPNISRLPLVHQDRLPKAHREVRGWRAGGPGH